MVHKWPLALVSWETQPDQKKEVFESSAIHLIGRGAPECQVDVNTNDLLTVLISNCCLSAVGAVRCISRDGDGWCSDSNGSGRHRAGGNRLGSDKSRNRGLAC